MSNEIKVISSRKIYEVLDAMRQKPHLWLTTKSIIALQDFLNGYMQLGFADDIYYPGEPNIDDFKYWILNRDQRELGVGNSYSTVLLHECNGNEEKAFDKFFEYLDKFKSGQRT